MAYLKLFQDAACEVPFAAIPSVKIEPTWYQRNPQRRMINGKEYLCMNNVFIEAPFNPAGSNPPFTSNRNRWHAGKWFYTESRLRFTITETNVIGANCAVSDVYADSTRLTTAGAGSQVQQDTYCAWWFFEFEKDGVTYYMIPGFLRFPRGDNTIYCLFAAEKSFWESDFRDSYSYGEGTDDAGGQGDGAIPHTNIPLSSTPQRVVPFGGHGLHAYRINNQAYNSIQGYLWGESSTIAKALWQKFQNKTHNPTSCIVGCYSLPGEFMPSGSAASGVQLAGMLLTPISGTCQDVSQAINFVDKTYEFGKIDPPFGSWLDYSGVQVIIRIPFCGVIQAAAEYCIGKNITIRYRVDQLNGNLVCIVYADGRVIAETSGNCAYNVPVSGGDDGTLQRLGAAVTGILQITAGNYAGALSSAAEAAGAVHQTQLVNSDMHGSMTACENRVPYIEWIYPTTAYTADYPNANGLPCEFSGTLGSFSGGYGEFEVMPASLSIPEATAAEKEEIASLLRGGVIV